VPLPDEIVGYYSWNWGAGSTGPPGANAGCAFTGLIDVKNAIAQYTEGSSWCCPTLKGIKHITLGGGNSAGTFTAAALQGIISNAALIKQAGYAAVMYDVEEVSGSSSKMIPLFRESFAALKHEGLIVAITTSHSAPYQCDTPEDAVAFVKSWAADANLDIISPQLYSSGRESAPEFAETNSCKDAGCTWDLYKGSKAAIVPSLVEAGHYAATKAFFANMSISLKGYYQWAQTSGSEQMTV